MQENTYLTYNLLIRGILFLRKELYEDKSLHGKFVSGLRCTKDSLSFGSVWSGLMIVQTATCAWVLKCTSQALTYMFCVYGRPSSQSVNHPHSQFIILVSLPIANILVFGYRFLIPLIITLSNILDSSRLRIRYQYSSKEVFKIWIGIQYY